MDDMTPTDKLRALLDERGIKYTILVPSNYTAWKHDGTHCTVIERFDKLYLETVQGPLTPEQAIAATAGTEPDEATMLKLHDRMNAALLDYESAMGIEGGNGANTVPFVIEMHSLLEEAATMGARGTCKDLGGVGADDEVVFNCSECGCVLSVFDKDGINNLCMSFIDDYPRFCPECGRRIIEEVTE